jgi:hypothetical protein
MKQGRGARCGLGLFWPSDVAQSIAGSGMLRVTMTAKQEVRSMLEKLPDNCSLEDIQYHLYVLEKVRSGLQDARENGTISQEDAELRLSKWLTE